MTAEIVECAIMEEVAGIEPNWSTPLWEHDVLHRTTTNFPIVYVFFFPLSCPSIIFSQLVGSHFTLWFKEVPKLTNSFFNACDTRDDDYVGRRMRRENNMATTEA